MSCTENFVLKNLEILLKVSCIEKIGTQKEIYQSIIEQVVKEKKVPVVAPLGLD